MLTRYRNTDGILVYYEFFPDNKNIVFTRKVFNVFDALIKIGGASKSLSSAGLILVMGFLKALDSWLSTPESTFFYTKDVRVEVFVSF